jgi:MFS family permease
MVIIMAGQILMIFNISTMQVAVDAIATTFRTSATSVGTAIVTYSLVCAGLILLGARVVQKFGSRRVFRAGVLAFGAAMAVMAASIDVWMVLLAQVMAGLMAAALVPTLVVLVAENYRNRQQEQALGWLGASPAMAIILAFLIAGALTTFVGWRAMYGLLVAFAAGIWMLSGRLAIQQTEFAWVSIDLVGVMLAALAILLISIGANNLIHWGGLAATKDAPFSLMDISPAPMMILGGIFLGQAFITWSRRRIARGRTSLLSLEVLDTPTERAAHFCIFIISALGSAVSFLIPLYIQVVQGGTSFATAIAVIPLSTMSLISAVLVVRLYGRWSPSSIARKAFLLVAIGFALLGTVIRNDWSNVMVMFSMAVIGLGEGALVTLLFNVIVTASPKRLAGDVGSARGTVNNLASAVGTALAGALVIGVLAATIHKDLVHNPLVPDELRVDVSMSSPAFVSNDQLRGYLARREVTPDQVDEAVRINTDARLRALKLAFFAFAGLALLAYFPADALPGYRRESTGESS